MMMQPFQTASMRSGSVAGSWQQVDVVGLIEVEHQKVGL